MNKIELAEKVWESIKSSKAKAKKFQDDVLVSFSLISEEPDDNIYVAVKNGELTVAPYRYDDNNCDVQANAEAVAKMFAGEITFAKAIEDGLVQVKGGEAAKLMALECLVPAKKAAAKKTTAAKAPAKKAAAKTTTKKTTAKAETKTAAKTEAKAAPAAKTEAKTAPAAKTETKAAPAVKTETKAAPAVKTEEKAAPVVKTEEKAAPVAKTAAKPTSKKK